MDPLGAVIRIGRRYSPRLAAEAQWMRSRRHSVLRRAVDASIERGDTVCDVGASLGGFTARMLRLVGPRGAVHAFEPNPESARELARVGARRSNLHVHRVALSQATGTATLRVPVVDGAPAAGMSSLEVPAGREGLGHEDVAVPTARLQDELGDVERLTFMKIDVEGHEDAMLVGAGELLERHRPSVVIEIEQRHRRSDVGEAFARFAALGYDGWAFFPGGLRPLDDFDLERDQLRFVGDGPLREDMPEEYVHNFMFVAAGTTPASELLEETRATG